MSLRVWIVCLMLALLPLRGWAAASMTVPAMAPNAVTHAEHTMSPCHEAAGDDSAPAGHACNLCDLCHGAVADLATPTLPQLPLPDMSPRPAVARDTGRHAVGGLERPPRSFLA